MFSLERFRQVITTNKIQDDLRQVLYINVPDKNRSSYFPVLLENEYASNLDIDKYMVFNFDHWCFYYGVDKQCSHQTCVDVRQSISKVGISELLNNASCSHKRKRTKSDVSNEIIKSTCLENVLHHNSISFQDKQIIFNGDILQGINYIRLPFEQSLCTWKKDVIASSSNIVALQSCTTRRVDALEIGTSIRPIAFMNDEISFIHIKLASFNSAPYQIKKSTWDNLMGLLELLNFCLVEFKSPIPDLELSDSDVNVFAYSVSSNFIFKDWEKSKNMLEHWTLNMVWWKHTSINKLQGDFRSFISKSHGSLKCYLSNLEDEVHFFIKPIGMDKMPELMANLRKISYNLLDIIQFRHLTLEQFKTVWSDSLKYQGSEAFFNSIANSGPSALVKIQVKSRHDVCAALRFLTSIHSPISDLTENNFALLASSNNNGDGILPAPSSDQHDIPGTSF